MNQPTRPQTRIVFYGSDRDSLAKLASQQVNNLYLNHRKLASTSVIEGVTTQVRSDVTKLLSNSIGDGRGRYVLTPATAVRLVAFDVDSTLVNGEVIDMIAAHWGVGAQVAAVTQAAMEGQLDFNASLRERVALLAGCPATVLTTIHDTLPLNPGAYELMAILHTAGVATMMVSGGFSTVTAPLAKALGMTACFSNQLEIIDGTLTGKVIGEIINGEAKRAHVLETCQTLGISPGEAAAVGDGANDLLMMGSVGTGIAYNAKPVVQANADMALNDPDLTLVAALLGIGDEELGYKPDSVI